MTNLDQLAPSAICFGSSSEKPIHLCVREGGSRCPQRVGKVPAALPPNPDLPVYNPDGQPETVRYDAGNAMLLNEFLKYCERPLPTR